MTASSGGGGGAPRGEARGDAPPADLPLLVVRDLVKHFPIREGVLNRVTGAVRAVDGVSFDLERGETLGLVGESGCGKSTAGRTILRLLEPDSGQILLQGRDITTLSRRQLRPFRKDFQIVFQDPYSSLNPRMTVEQLIAEPMVINGFDPQETRDRVTDLMGRVGLDTGRRNRYPKEFSGGQRQRIGVARALSLNPELLILDEPVSALDVSIQAQVVNLLRDLQQDLSLSYVFIAHDLAVVRNISTRVAVMYLGKIMEIGTRQDIYARPSHPYTQGLLSSVPIADPSLRSKRQRTKVQGDIPSPSAPPSGCRFRTRCFKAQPECAESEPPLIPFGDSERRVACFFPEVIDVLKPRDDVAG